MPPVPLARDSSCCVWDLRATPPDGDVPDHKMIKKWFKRHCKKHAFQLEKGAVTGLLHFQCRASFKGKMRKSQVFDLWRSAFPGGTSVHVSPTSKENRDNCFYVLKEDTRLSGPWQDTDRELYIQHRYKEFEFRDWQERLELRIRKDMADRDDRHIIIVHDAQGGSGKSFFKGALMSQEDLPVVNIPPFYQNVEDMCKHLCSCKEIEDGWRGVVLLDVPRATSPKHWYTLAAGLEFMKQGFLSDGRYGVTTKTIEPPIIVAFCNVMPPPDILSSDVISLFQQ